MTAPDGLGPLGIETWNKCVEQLRSFGILSVSDRDCLKRYCQLTEFCEQAAAALKDEGLVGLDDKGRQQKSAHWQIFKECCEALRACETNLGFNPTARIRLTGKPGGKEADQKDNSERFFQDAI